MLECRKAIPLEVTCPCCETLLKIHPHSGKILAHGEEALKPIDLGDVVKRVEGRDEKLKDSFAEALDAERNRKKELEDLFRKAADKAKDSDGEKPPENPLDDRWR